MAREKYQKIDRSNYKPNLNKDDDNDHLDIGWHERTLRDGRPCRVEYWTLDGISAISIYVPCNDIEHYSDEDFKNLFISEDLIYPLPGRDAITNPNSHKIIDGNGNEIWEVIVVIGDEDDSFVKTNFSIEKYPN